MGIFFNPQHTHPGKLDMKYPPPPGSIQRVGMGEGGGEEVINKFDPGVWEDNLRVASFRREAPLFC